MVATYILMAVIAYAIGSVNFSVILSKKMAGFDVREKGSGNAGTTVHTLFHSTERPASP